MKMKCMSALVVLGIACALMAGCARATEAESAVQENETAAANAEEKQEEVSAVSAAGYEEKNVPVFNEKLTDQTVPLRFYSEAPHVAYMGIRQYFDLMLGGGLVLQEDGEGIYTLTNAAGAKANVDTAKGIVSIEDMPSFVNYYQEAYAGRAGSFKDSMAPYLKLREVVYEGDPAPVEFDLGSLGIAVYGDGDDVWLPVSVLTSWLSDIAQNRVVYNGRFLYMCRESNAYAQDNSCFDTEYYDSILTGGDRADDLTAYTYAELGFIFRYMYGYPGRTGLDDEILRNEGFDAALAAAGDEGEKLRESLSSKNFSDFWFGMFSLSNGLLEDGHNYTSLEIGVVDADETEKYKTFREYTWDKLSESHLSEFTMGLLQASSGIHDARPMELEESKYYRSGDTAVIVLDAFTVDESGWNAYYSDEGELPDDTMGTAAKGLIKASEDGVSNVLLDVSANMGGYSDSVAGVLSLMTGRDYLCGYDELSKQSFKIYFDVDRNLDGKIDEKEKKVNYDFNYAVMTSNCSFSCGNLFPFLVRDEGGMVIGGKSGGGSCSVQKAVLSEGFEINISGSKFKLTNSEGDDLEEGISPDVEIKAEVRNETNEFTGQEMPVRDYSKFGETDEICKSVSEWYAKQ